jgi:hypothetical protein
MVAAITTNLDLAAAPGNVALTGRNSGLARDTNSVRKLRSMVSDRAMKFSVFGPGWPC